MSGTNYLDGDTLAQCREAIRQGSRIIDLAARLGVNPSHLARMLGMPVIQPVPAAADQDGDLFEGSERLQEVL